MLSLGDNPADDEARSLLVDMIQALGILIEHCTPVVRVYLRPALDSAEILTDLAVTRPTGLAHLRLAGPHWTVLASLFSLVLAPESPTDSSFVRGVREAVRSAGLGDTCVGLRDRATELTRGRLPALPAAPAAADRPTGGDRR